MERSLWSARLAGGIILTLLATLLPLASATARPPHLDDRPADPSSRAFPPFAVADQDRPVATVSRLATVPQVALDPCDDPAWLCGSIAVPIDRARPNGRKIGIGFEVLPHSGPGPGARDAIIVTAGGPGISTTADRYFWQFLMGPLLAERDLLLVDSRGTGKSSPLDCPDLQKGGLGHDEVVVAVGECGEQLGDDSDRYGNGDVALDVEVVRRLLGYPRLSYFGPSYGAAAVQAYAVRFPHRLRVAVADAGVPLVDRAHSDTWGLDFPRAMARNTALACLRSPTCEALQPGAWTALHDLARALRRQPVDGAAYDRFGTLRDVHVDERALIDIVFADILNPSELAAASAALERGDERPLLRLAAEGFFEPGEPEDPAFFSAGLNAAAFCNDVDFVWDRGDSVPVKRAKLRDALQALGPRPFEPFSTETWVDWFWPDYCIRWPAPDRFVPAVPTGATVSDVPVLITGGDIDLNVPSATAHRLKGVFPNARYVNFAGALHLPTAWSECARAVMQRFIATLRTGRTDCAGEPAFLPAPVPQFPLRAGQAAVANPLRSDRSTVLDRRVVTVAVRSALDALLRSFRIPGATGTGHGLHGGTFDFDFGDQAADLWLHGVRFTRGVEVSGRLTLTYDGNAIDLRLIVDGPGGHDGRLGADGAYGFGGPYRSFRVTGEIGGRVVAASVPAD